MIRRVAGLNRSQLSRIVRAEWGAIVRRSGCNSAIEGMLPKGPLKILGGSTKTEKGEKRGILTGVVYMAPADSSGREVCVGRTGPCTRGCLGDHAGRMGFDPGVKRAQQWKVALRFGARGLYDCLLELDLIALENKAAKLGFIAAARLDGTSDLGDAEKWAKRFPTIQFYEYSKVVARVARWLALGLPNLSVTLSYSGENTLECLTQLAAGGNVAVPFDTKKGEPLPLTWYSFPVLDGDEDDYRADDAPGHVVGLSWKGPQVTRREARGNGWLQEAKNS